MERWITMVESCWNPAAAAGQLKLGGTGYRMALAVLLVCCCPLRSLDALLNLHQK